MLINYYENLQATQRNKMKNELEVKNRKLYMKDMQLRNQKELIRRQNKYSQSNSHILPNIDPQPSRTPKILPAKKKFYEGEPHYSQKPSRKIIYKKKKKQ